MKGDYIYDQAEREWAEEPENETVEYDYDEPDEEVDNWY